MIKIELKEVLKNASLITNESEIEFSITSKLDSKIPGSLSFLESGAYVSELLNNNNIKYVITTEEIATKHNLKEYKKIIISSNPKYEFYILHNYIITNKTNLEPSKVHESVVVGENSSIAKTGVIIGKGTILGPNVTILEGVSIGENCVIGPGCVIGNDSFECIKHQDKILTVKHDGKVIIYNNVELGSNTTIDKGLMGKNTTIFNDVKMDNQVHISHNVTIERCTLLAASVTIAGNTQLGKNIWVGPGAIISNRLIIGDNAKISLGAVVAKNVPENETVTGNFAIKHNKFMKNHFRNSRE
mgnify:FL=1